MNYLIAVKRFDIVEVNALDEEKAKEIVKNHLLQQNPKDIFTLEVIEEAK